MVNRSIASVLGCLIVISLISGCSTTKKIEISASPVDRPKLVLPKADELNMRKVEWVILTEKNVEAQFAKLKSSGRAIAFFAITDQGYENLGSNISNIRAYIEQQHAILGAYESYYLEAEKAIESANAKIESAKSQVEQQQRDEPKRTFWQKLVN